MTLPRSVIDGLRQKAARATRGDWFVSDLDGSIMADQNGLHVDVGPVDFRSGDFEHVVAASPDVVLAVLEENERLHKHVAVLSSACEALRVDNERLKRAPTPLEGATLVGCVHCSLLEAREKQATEMCTWLTAENQRLRDAVKIAKHLAGEWDEVLEQGEEDAVENAHLQNRISALEAALGEACEIAEAPDPWISKREKQLARISALRKVGQP